MRSPASTPRLLLTFLARKRISSMSIDSSRLLRTGRSLSFPTSKFDGAPGGFSIFHPVGRDSIMLFFDLNIFLLLFEFNRTFYLYFIYHKIATLSKLYTININQKKPRILSYARAN